MGDCECINSKPAVQTSFIQLSADPAPEDQLANEMTHDLEMNFNKIAPFGKEDTAKELQDHAAKTQDTLVDAVENAEVAEIKRAVFRALTRLRAATIKEFDTIARLETQAIDAYNDAHHYRAENPLAHLHKECDWLLQNFDARKEARAGEVEAMKKAKAAVARRRRRRLRVRQPRLRLKT